MVVKIPTHFIQLQKKILLLITSTDSRTLVKWKLMSDALNDPNKNRFILINADSMQELSFLSEIFIILSKRCIDVKHVWCIFSSIFQS